MYKIELDFLTQIVNMDSRRFLWTEVGNNKLHLLGYIYSIMFFQIFNSSK